MEYRHFGVMLDCSRGGVLRPEEVCRFIDLLVSMGYDTLELYTEDVYELPGEPYFGYLRGRYTKDELRAIDRYAQSRGVELIPCVQTLAHNTHMSRHRCYAERLIDTGDILLCGEERTYEFLEKIFATLAECFTSRNVNIGMDEAFRVGLGRYLSLHGYREKREILREHLVRVAGIAAKYGFTAHMWSDMICHYRDDGGDFPLPENVGLVLWNYSEDDPGYYDRALTQHEAFGRELWYAGGAWSWMGFAPFNRYSLPRLRAGMQEARRHGVSNILVTMWSEEGKECSYRAMLPALYAARRYADGVTDEDEIRRGFRALFGAEFDDLLLLDLPNHLPGVDPERSMQNPCKMFLYQDPLCGVFDRNEEDYLPIPYGEIAGKLEAKRGLADYGDLFDVLGRLCRVLEIKADLGIRTRRAYLAGDRDALRKIANGDCPELLTRLDAFTQAFRTLWRKENKPFGWEIHDARLGGLAARLRSARAILSEYLDGTAASIPELEEVMLPYDRPWDNIHGGYRDAVSTSSL